MVATHRIRRGLETRRLFGDCNDRFKVVERPRQPCCQTVRQQAEGHLACWTIPAGDACSWRCLTLVSTMTCKGTAAVRMMRATGKTCIVPCLATNVLLAGEPRIESKLHRLRPGRASPHRATPCSAYLLPSLREASKPRQCRKAVELWTRPSRPSSRADRSAPCGPHGQAVDKRGTLTHRLTTLADLAPTTPQPQQQFFVEVLQKLVQGIPHSFVFPDDSSTSQCRIKRLVSNESMRDTTPVLDTSVSPPALQLPHRTLPRCHRGRQSEIGAKICHPLLWLTKSETQ